MNKVKHEKSDKTVEFICNEIMEGKSLRSICEDNALPSAGTFLRWVSTDKAIMEQYTRARGLQADYFADEMAQIADDCLPIADNVQKAKLQIETRKWAASKIKPKKYGEKIQQEHSGGVEITKIVDDITKPS